MADKKKKNRTKKVQYALEKRVMLDAAAIAGGIASLNYEFFDGTVAGNTVDNIPTGTPDATGVATDLDAEAIAIAETGSDNTFSIRYTATFIVETAGTYTFTTTSTDGSSININGVEIVDNDGLHGDQLRSGSVTLSAGTHTLELLHFQRNTSGAGASGDLFATVSGPDTGNVATSLIGGAAAVEDTTINIDVSSNALPGATTTYSIVSGATNGTASIDASGVITYTADPDFNGSDEFDYQVNGFLSGLNYEFYDFSPAGDTVDNIPTTGADGTGVVNNFDVQALAVENTASSERYSLRYTGDVLITTDGTYTFTTRSDDGSKLFINGTEVVDNDGAHGARTRSGSIFLTAGFHSLELEFFERTGGDVLEATISGADTGGVAVDLYASNIVGRNGTTQTITQHIDVTPVNDVPSGIDETVTLAEDGSHTFTSSDFSFTDADDALGSAGANDLLNVILTTLPTDGDITLNGVAVTAGQSISEADISAGLLVYTPDMDVNGTAADSFTFQVQDDGGTNDGGVDTDATANTLTLDITPTNDAPVLPASGPFSVGENAADTDAVGTITAATDIDLPADTITYSITGGTGAALFQIDNSGNITVDGNGNFDFEGGTTSYTLDIVANDGTVDSNTITVTVNITDENDAPVLPASGPFSVGEDAANTTSVGTINAATDEDVPADTITYSIAAGNTDSIFAIDANTGEITIADNTNLDFEATNSYTLDIVANDGTVDSNTVSVVINITDVNEAPVIINNTAPVQTIDFNTIAPVSSQNGDGGDFEEATILDGGTALHLAGNAWQRTLVNLTVTADTVIEFDFVSILNFITLLAVLLFSSQMQAEIQRDPPPLRNSRCRKWVPRDLC